TSTWQSSRCRAGPGVADAAAGLLTLTDLAGGGSVYSAPTTCQGGRIMGRLVALLVTFAFALAGTTTAWAQPPKDPPKPQPKAPAAKKAPLDINSASADDLKALKGSGEADDKR